MCKAEICGTRQRIDLFGAQKQDLPDIWEELVAAGFESGHAYGTSK
jgi:nitrite reductase (NAD(P)H)